MKTIFFTILWLSPVLNAALYWYRKSLDKELKEGKCLKVGADVHKVVISGPKNWLWFRHCFEDVLLKAILVAIPAIILKDSVFFLIFLSVGLAALVLQIGITLYPFPWPVFFWKKGSWTFYNFTFYYVRGFSVFLLGIFAPAAILLAVGGLFMTEPIILYSEPTVLARFLDNSVGTMPVWVYYALIIPFIGLMVANIFYLWFKITPLLTRFYVEYDNEVLRLISRVTRREIARIDFKKSYAYEQAYDLRRSFETPRESPVHIFAQDNKAIALTFPGGPSQFTFPLGTSQSFIKKMVSKKSFDRVSTVWSAKLSSAVSVTYVVTPEESEEFFGEKVKKYWKKV